MAKEYKFEGGTFDLDDSKGCYIEASHNDLVGHVGVYLQGTTEQPYCWYDGDSFLTKDGLINGNSYFRSMEGNLHGLCKALVRKHRDAQAHDAFKPEETCEALHEFVKSLPE